MNELTEKYESFYLKSSFYNIFPNEYIVRIFRGHYPNHTFRNYEFQGKTICDVGCGDGRNLIVPSNLGMICFGTEITESISLKASENLKSIGIKAEIMKGFNHLIPFIDSSFDMLLSWNACYYMGSENQYFSIEEYFEEFARVLKSDGYFILSAPMKTNFIFNCCEPFKSGYVIVENDPYSIRNGHIFKLFDNEEEIKKLLSDWFYDFSYASLFDDCFGQANHYHILICRKKF